MFPNLEVVSRDRDCAMASAAEKLGMTSVADRFHITANMHNAIERTLHASLPSSMCIPIGNSWTYITCDEEGDEIAVCTVPASLSASDIRLRVRMAHLSAKEEKTYRDTLKVLELTTLGKQNHEIANIMDIPIEKVRTLRNGMRETISEVENRIDAFCDNPATNGNKKQKSVSVSAGHSSRTIVAPYHDTVVAMRANCCSHCTIHEEISKMGFTGSHSTVDNYSIKLSREASIEREMRENFNQSWDLKDLTPVRPERIAVSVLSVKKVYERILSKIRSLRPQGTDDEQIAGTGDAHDSASTTETTANTAATGINSPEKAMPGKKN
jgi:hypothetical protein